LKFLKLKSKNLMDVDIMKNYNQGKYDDKRKRGGHYNSSSAGWINEIK
jgi:hypothetical protein